MTEHRFLLLAGMASIARWVANSLTTNDGCYEPLPFVGRRCDWLPAAGTQNPKDGAETWEVRAGRWLVQVVTEQTRQS